VLLLLHQQLILLHLEPFNGIESLLLDPSLPLLLNIVIVLLNGLDLHHDRVVVVLLLSRVSLVILVSDLYLLSWLSIGCFLLIVLILSMQVS
jgi:hypothetical protein